MLSQPHIQFFFTRRIFAQETSNSIVLSGLSFRDTVVQLPQKYILQNSEHLVCDSVILTRNTDYMINYTAGTIRFRKDSSFFAVKKDSVYSVKITYRNFPFTLPIDYDA